MKRKFLPLILIGILFLTACSQGEDPTEPFSKPPGWIEVEGNGEFDGFLQFYRRNAYQFTEDGWFYSFEHQGQKDPSRDFGTDGYILYTYRTVNLRYLFPDSAIRVREYEAKSIKRIQTVARPQWHWAESSEAKARDMEHLYEDVLKHDGTYRTVDEMLGLDPDDFSFEELDKDLFFRLMREALTRDPLPENYTREYLDKFSTAFYWEPEHTDGYWFQVCYAMCMGYVDAVYIDVLYETGPGYKDYVQLSDLVDAGTATGEQAEAFALMKRVRDAVVDKDCFIELAEEYRDKTIGGIDFSRLYRFLKDIHENHYEKYGISNVILEQVDVPLSS